MAFPEKGVKNRPLRPAAVFACAFLLLGLLFAPARGAGKPLTLYTAMTATTPQIPLWAAINAGWPQGRELRVEYWKSLDDLRGLILAGKGDLWVGHLEGFVQAARRGAPITLIAVTAWKKFYFVAAGGEEEPRSLEGMAAALRQKGEPLAVAPRDSPAIGVLEELGRSGGASFTIESMPPQQAMLAMIRGARSCALLPEPLLSVLLDKKTDLRIIASLEEEMARLSGGQARLPLAGIAVRTSLLREDPALVRGLVRAMRKAAEDLAGRPAEALAVLPQSVRGSFAENVLESSLSRDPLLVIPAQEARREILSFLRLVLPDSFPPEGGELPEFFLPWEDGE
jgi:NitT/TauT family transport system substrate-binding protein